MKPASTLFVLFFALCASPVFGGEPSDLESLFGELDHVIAHRDEYTARREACLDSLKRELNNDGLTLRTRFDLTEQLAENYSSYQSDSSLFYLRQSLAIADQIGDNDLIVRARSSIVLCYSLGGRFFEAEEILDRITDSIHVSRRTLLTFYVAQHRKNRELAYRTEPGERRDAFRRRELYYAQRAAAISDNDFTRLYYGYMEPIIRKDWTQATILCDSLLACVPPDSHEYAKAANHKALLERRAGHADEELAWYLRSAMADIQSAVRDHGSLCAISSVLFDRGDVQRAMYYIRIAINDTRFFNSPSRSWRDMAILPQIESAYSERNTRLHTMYIVLIVIVLLFFVSAVGVGLYVLSQNRRLYTVQQILQESNEKLNELTHSLRETNACLSSQNIRIADANRIKEFYIGGFLQIISEYINKLSGTYQYVNKMLRDDRIAELRREYARSDVRNEELKEFYALFDKTFLGLFPSFIDALNNLLTEEARTVGRKGELTTVLRIYALIRLGITDTTTIAALLHCSVRTVYNYRSFTQRHALIDRGDFDQQVQLIGITELSDNAEPIL